MNVSETRRSNQWNSAERRLGVEEEGRLGRDGLTQTYEEDSSEVVYPGKSLRNGKDLLWRNG